MKMVSISVFALLLMCATLLSQSDSSKTPHESTIKYIKVRTVFGDETAGVLIKENPDGIFIRMDSGVEVFIARTDIASSMFIEKQQQGVNSELPGRKRFNSFGFTAGFPAAANLNFGYHYDDVALHISGMYVGHYYGAEIAPMLCFYNSAFTTQYVGLLLGVAATPAEQNRYNSFGNVVGTEVIEKPWYYGGVGYALHTKGFYLQIGGVYGTGNEQYTNFRLIGQIGYVYCFY